MSPRDEILEALRRHWPEMRRRGARSLWIFGSAATGQARADSDVDLVVDFEGPTTFDMHMGLWEYLEALLGRPVDLLTLRGLKPRFRQRIADEMLQVA